MLYDIGEVCTETQFFSESFGDGVSETESEDEEEDAAPITIHPAHTTPTTPRPQSRPSSPSRMSRSHSPLSDMDTESKRNSQAVSTEPSDLEDHSSLTTSDLESCHDLAALDARKDKAYRIVLELLHTERTYVKVLHLIDQEFQFRVDNENRAHHMFPQDVIPHMFSNVKSIYKLHHDFLLPQLEERMAQWEQNRRIGDIMKSFAPFLKMYTEYVRNFDNAMTLISQWQSKCPRFAAIMDEIHRPAAKTPSNVAKKSRVAVTLDVKLDILKRHEHGDGMSVIGRVHGLAPSTVHSIVKSADKIKEMAGSATPLTATKNINGVWRKLRPEYVHNSISFPSVPAIRKTIVTFAKKAGFDEVDDADIEDLLDSHNEDLIELERLQQEEMPLAMGEDADETPTQLLTVRILRKLISSFEMAMDIALEMDPNVDRSCTIIRNVKKDIRAYYEPSTSEPQPSTSEPQLSTSGEQQLSVQIDSDNENEVADNPGSDDESEVADVPGSEESEVADDPGSEESEVADDPGSEESEVADDPGSDDESEVADDPGSEESEVAHNPGSDDESEVADVPGSEESESLEVCGNLTLQHHMLSPVQRIPRYEMLLRDYLKKLPEDSPDRHDTEKALHLVSTAANHANDAMKKIDKFEKLLEIQESLGGAEDLVSPTRELIKEGKIIKISARSGDHQERYIFLLTDLLLLCSPRLMGGRVMSGPQYRLRAKYHVENLMVQEGDNLETANTFYIKDNNKSVELYTQTLEEKEQWLEAFIRAIHETSQRKSSLKLHFNPDQRIVDVDLGQKQPMLIRSDSVTKCMLCSSQFTMVRRKHHCRACGEVVCSKCSGFKASLAYESGKSVRVCRDCHKKLQELSSSTATPSPEIDEADECSLYSTKEPPDLPFRNRGVLEVSAKTGGAVIQGFLQLKTHRKTWVKRWFALHTDFVLYSFKCEADDHALTATPVPGFTVTHLQGTRNESGISEKEKERAFKLYHSKKHYIFQAASKEDSQRWVAALKKASQAELPSPVQ
ncbi:FYVE, RhoGEF and PH domain-containing protein 4-like [Homarus americanus]|uniref:FYVE, RhoGEF and PH domain-containing protein 4-like n=1 Tax=Homarus americanus TaxID=6706 RepID=A0A8J5NB92_HOMAM|nr:FYVE, RhoGEF and PH domain-containing protein 4-like [Homarus americanus]